MQNTQQLTHGLFLMTQVMNRQRYDVMPEGVGQVGPDEKFLYANPALEKIF